MAIEDTIALFTKVNQDCEQTGESVVPFSDDPETIEFYMTQMENLEFAPTDMEEFKSFLETQSTGVY